MKSSKQQYFSIFLFLYGIKGSEAQSGFVMKFQNLKNHSKLTTDAFAEFTGISQHLSSHYLQCLIKEKSRKPLPHSRHAGGSTFSTSAPAPTQCGNTAS